MREVINYKAKSPISFYIGLIGILVFAISIIIQIEFPDSLIYPGLVALIWFYTVSRFACYTDMTNDNMLRVQYLAPWHQSRDIDLNQYFLNDVVPNYWSFKSNCTAKNYVFYDTLIFKNRNGETIMLKVNLRMGHLNKLITYLIKRQTDIIKKLKKK